MGFFSDHKGLRLVIMRKLKWCTRCRGMIHHLKKIIKEGVLSRQIMSSAGILYTKRQVVLTQKCFYFGKVGSGDVLDWIPLLEIKHGTKKYHLSGLESPHVSRRNMAGNTNCFKKIYRNPSHLFHLGLGVDLGSDPERGLRVAKTVRLANDQDRQSMVGGKTAEYDAKGLAHM